MRGGTLVFDASTLIAISDMRRPDMFDRFRDLGYDLVVPSHMAREELIDANVKAMICGLLDRGIIRIVGMNGRTELHDLRMKFQGLDLGESDAMLTCIKMQRRGTPVSCVLDEKGARAVAGQIGIKRVGLVGLLGELATAGLVSAQDMAGIVAALRGTNFRISGDLLDGLAGGI